MEMLRCPMNIGDRIVELRERAGMKQYELAQKANMNPAVLNRIETGKRPARDDEIKTIAQIFHVSTDYLLGNSDSNSYYLNPETARMAQELHDNPEYRAMFDATRKLSPEAVKEVMNFIAYQTKKEEGHDDD